MKIERRAFLAMTAAATALPASAAEPGFVAPDAAMWAGVPGGRLYARVNGRLGPDAKTPLLMIHGGPGSGHSGFMPALGLARDRAVALYDQLDCGRSDTPGDPVNWRVERFLAEIDAIRAAFGLTRVHILGSSWGGTLALEYAARRPEGLASVILQSPLVSTASWMADCAILRAALPAPVRAALDEGDRSGDFASLAYQAASEVFNNRHLRREPRPAWLERYRAALPVPFASNLYNYMWGPNEFVCTGTLKNYDGTALLAKIAAPALVMTGEFDEARAETCRHWAEAIPGAQFAEVKGAGHSIANDRPVGFVNTVGGFIARHDRA